MSQLKPRFLHINDRLNNNGCSCGETKPHRHCVYCDATIFNFDDFLKHGKETGHWMIVGAPVSSDRKRTEK